MKVKSEPINRKPDSWYKEYYITGIRVEIEMGYLKRKGNILNQSDIEFIEKDKKNDELIDLINEKYSMDVSKYLSEIRPTIEGNEYYYSIPFEDYIKLIEKYNSVKGNRELIKKYEERLSTLPVDRYLNSKINFLKEIIPRFLVTHQLYTICDLIDDYEYDCSDEYQKRFNKTFNFKYSKKEVLDLIRKEVKWRAIERDIAIYREREKGRLLEDIAKGYNNLKLKAISKIVNKVKGSVNYYKGKLFEKKYFQYLESLNIYNKIVWDGASGQADIFGFKNNELYIFSLKNLKIDRKNYIIKKKDLRPEYERAYKGLLENDNVFLKLVVFDNLTDKIIEKELYFRNPTDININP